MYRLVVVLTILSLSGSEATGPKRERSDSPDDAHNEATSSGVLKAARLELHSRLTRSARGESSGASQTESNTFAGNAQTQETGSQILGATQLELNDKLNGRVYLDSLLGSELFRNLRQSTDGYSQLLYKLILKFVELRWIKKGIMKGRIVCSKDNLNQLIAFENSMEGTFAKRSNQIDTGLDSFIMKEFSWIAEKFLTYCLPKHKEKFDAISNDRKLEYPIERMGVFESLIDEEKAAQRNGYPRYCNDEMQAFDVVKLKRLVSEMGNTVGKELSVNEDNITSINSQPRETKEVMLDYFGSTCQKIKFYKLDDSMNFIMSAKRSFKFNREWNLMFDCGEKMGRYQLCWAADEIYGS